MYTYYYQLFLVLLLLFFMTNCNDQPGKQMAESEVSFPDDWLGKWEGELKIYNDTGMTMNILMGLELEELIKDSLFQWALIYDLNGGEDRRNYFLKPVDASNGHWITDEDNSIILDGFRIDNGYYTVFELGVNRIETSYILEEGRMLFENRVINTDTLRISGGTIIEGTQIPNVTSYQVTGIQKAELKRIKTH